MISKGELGQSNTATKTELKLQLPYSKTRILSLAHWELCWARDIL